MLNFTHPINQRPADKRFSLLRENHRLIAMNKRVLPGDFLPLANAYFRSLCLTHHILGRITVADADHFLFNNGTSIQILCYIVTGSSISFTRSYAC